MAPKPPSSTSRSAGPGAPLRAASTARAAAVVVLPTPPGPAHTITRRRSRALVREGEARLFDTALLYQQNDGARRRVQFRSMASRRSARSTLGTRQGCPGVSCGGSVWHSLAQASSCA